MVLINSIVRIRYRLVYYSGQHGQESISELCRCKNRPCIEGGAINICKSADRWRISKDGNRFAGVSRSSGLLKFASKSPCPLPKNRARFWCSGDVEPRESRFAVRFRLGAS